MDKDTVDLVYLDPPFNSNQNFNMLYKERDGSRSAAQQKAFSDTWKWDPKAAKSYRQVVEGGGSVSDVLDAFRRILGGGPGQASGEMLAYLSMMSPRLVELRRVLKPTGGLYLHCDPTASHFLKLLLDAIFGPTNFRNEIIWKRTSSHNDSRKWPHVHDVLLFYAGRNYKWHTQFLSHDPTYVKKFYRHEDKRGRYRLHEIIRTASMGPRRNLVYEYHGYTPEWGWRTIRSKVAALDVDGRIEWGKNTGDRPYLKRYLHEQKGTPASSIWIDIPPVSAKAAERQGYPTQKPEPLLRRIIAASSDENDIVLDPFCGCGTTIATALDMKRRWIGIDITHLAIEVIGKRLGERGLKEGKDYKVDGRFAPPTFPDIETMAGKDKHTFQGWALRQAGVEDFQLKPGPDRGIDARKVFFDPAGSTERREIIVSVKGGKLPAGCVRDLIGTVQRERAQIGVLITLRKPTRNMVRDAADAPSYRGSDGRTYSGVQILTVKDLLEGHALEYPLQLAVSNQTTAIPPVAAVRAFELEPATARRKMAKVKLPLGFAQPVAKRS